jgi:membrane protein DedA with SNARE-associated domain
MAKKIFFISLIILLVFKVNAASQLQVTPAAVDSLSFIQHIEKWYKDNTNYFSITALMACESSILPVPSEMVIPPAVYVALEPDSSLSIFLIILFGTIGAMVGASFNYIVSRSLGRLLVYKFADSKVGKLFLLSSQKIQKAETFFNEHGKTSTFIGRFIPVIRHLISIPAGLSKMNYFHFLLFTALGAGLWNCVLALLGYVANQNREMINTYSREISGIFLIAGVVLIIWLIIKSIKKKKNA